MAATKIVPSRTALFLLDLQVIHSKVDPRFDTLMTQTASIIQKARSKGITMAHCRVAFTKSEIANIPDSNPTFSKLKDDNSRATMFNVDSPASAFHSAVTPEDGDIVVRKNRVGPFLNAPQDGMLFLKSVESIRCCWAVLLLVVLWRQLWSRLRIWIISFSSWKIFVQIPALRLTNSL